MKRTTKISILVGLFAIGLAVFGPMLAGRLKHFFPTLQQNLKVLRIVEALEKPDGRLRNVEKVVEEIKWPQEQGKKATITKIKAELDIGDRHYEFDYRYLEPQDKTYPSLMIIYKDGGNPETYRIDDYGNSGKVIAGYIFYPDGHWDKTFEDGASPYHGEHQSAVGRGYDTSVTNEQYRGFWQDEYEKVLTELVHVLTPET